MNPTMQLLALWKNSAVVGDVLLAKDRERMKLVESMGAGDLYMTVLALAEFIDRVTASRPARREFERIVRNFQKEVSK